MLTEELLLQEAKVFKDLVLTDTSKGLVHAFFAQRTISKVHFVNQGFVKCDFVKFPWIHHI